MRQENRMPDPGSDKKVSFFPFHAINEFMTDEYRQQVIRTVLEALPDLPDEHRQAINKVTSRHVKIPGFRNSLKAPLAIRARITIEAFEKHPDVVAAILSAWADHQPELRQTVFNLLAARGWELLPIDADRKKLPGFLTFWPKDETFERIHEAYPSAHPDLMVPENDVSLMVVWLSGRLPYQFTENSSER